MSSRWQRQGAAGLAALAMGAAAITFSTPASAATLPPCATTTEIVRSGHEIMVPTSKGNTSCLIGRSFAANTTIVARFQFTMRRCYPNLDLASPYSSEKVGELAVDGSFGPRSEAALKAVQSAVGTTADGIYGPKTRDRMKFLTPNRSNCYRY